MHVGRAAKMKDGDVVCNNQWSQGSNSWVPVIIGHLLRTRVICAKGTEFYLADRTNLWKRVKIQEVQQYLLHLCDPNNGLIKRLGDIKPTRKLPEHCGEVECSYIFKLLCKIVQRDGASTLLSLRAYVLTLTLTT